LSQALQFQTYMMQHDYVHSCVYLELCLLVLEFLLQLFI